MEELVGSWREIAIALVDAIFGEQKAQSCEKCLIATSGMNAAY